MRRWLLRWLAAASEAIAKAREADALPPDAQRELDRWEREDAARYAAEQARGERDAPPDAPHIDPDGI